MGPRVFLIRSNWRWTCALVLGCALLLGMPAVSQAQGPRILTVPGEFKFQEGQLVEYLAPPEATYSPERLPPPPDSLPGIPETSGIASPEQPTSSFVPLGSCLTANPAEAIHSATATIPQYLPEGMLPPITGHTSEQHRAYAIGKPLEGTSWLAASHSAGFFIGGIGGAMLIENQLEQSIGGTFGLRFGVDYDHRWGLEKRFGFAEMAVFDVSQHDRQIVNLEMGDVDLLFYPWGDTRWRPYMSAGAGLSHFNYQSDAGKRIDRLLVGLPFGIGVKYFWSEGVAVRAELLDNLMLGAHELSTMNNISLAAGIEFRYSGLHLGWSKS